jgi:hypothetical protein
MLGVPLIPLVRSAQRNRADRRRNPLKRTPTQCFGSQPEPPLHIFAGLFHAHSMLRFRADSSLARSGQAQSPASPPHQGRNHTTKHWYLETVQPAWASSRLKGLPPSRYPVRNRARASHGTAWGVVSSNTRSKPSMTNCLIVVRRLAAAIFVLSKIASGTSMVVFTWPYLYLNGRPMQPVCCASSIRMICEIRGLKNSFSGFSQTQSQCTRLCG